MKSDLSTLSLQIRVLWDQLSMDFPRILYLPWPNYISTCGRRACQNSTIPTVRVARIPPSETGYARVTSILDTPGLYADIWVVVNTTAMFYTFLAFLPLLDAGNTHERSPTVSKGMKSQFIATSSIGAYSRRPGAGFAYAGSKAACIHIIKQLATWMVPYGIRANTIAPGIYPSDMSAVCSLLSLQARPLLTSPVHNRHTGYEPGRLRTAKCDPGGEERHRRGKTNITLLPKLN